MCVSTESIIVLCINGMVLPLLAWVLKSVISVRESCVATKCQLERIVADVESEKAVRRDTTRSIETRLVEINRSIEISQRLSNIEKKIS